MTAQTLTDLQSQFGKIEGVSFFEMTPGFPIIRLECKDSITEISLYGAQILTFVQKNNPVPVIWRSKEAMFKAGKAIRGGVPICWPWFGPCPNRSDLPAHGFARTSFWTLDKLKLGCAHEGHFTLVFTLGDSETTRAVWPHHFKLTYAVACGTDLNLALAAANHGNEPFTYSGALHSYLGISGLEGVTLDGFDGIEYVDEVGTPTIRTQRGAIIIDHEIDRLYKIGQSGNPAVLSDPKAGRRTLIMKMGSQTTTVWNPWIGRAAKFVDFGNEEYREMICVEAVNAPADDMILQPAECRVLSQYIYTEKL